MINLFDPNLPVHVASRVINASNALFKQLVQQYNMHYNAVWNHPHPDQIVAAFGTHAVGIFTASGRLASYLNSLGANVPATSPSSWTVTFNSDGSAVATASS